MRRTMCNVDPLLHIFRDPKKKIHTELLYIDSDGLDVIFKLSPFPRQQQKAFVTQNSKQSAHFEIVDKAPRMIGFSGRKNILQEVDLSRLNAH